MRPRPRWRCHTPSASVAWKPRIASAILPFLPAVRAALCEAARGLLGVAPEVPLSFLAATESGDGRGAPAGSVGIAVGDGPRRLALFLWPGGRAGEVWMKGRHVALGYGR